MLENTEQEIRVLKHYCKVCNKSFECVGAHVIGDDNNARDEKTFMVKTQDSNNKNNKHSYYLREKMPRSFINYDDAKDGNYRKSSFKKFLSSSPPSPRSKSDDQYHHPLSEEEDLANCLVMLSNKSYVLSSGKEENKAKEVDKEIEKARIFQCKACKKIFNSHQALGGHRASHKKVKGCFASKLDDEEMNDQDSIKIDREFSTPSDFSDNSKRAKMHECSVCCRVFSSGQALGGHKRCHWLTTSSDNAFIPNFHYDQLYKKPTFTKPDLILKEQDDHRELNLNLNLQDPQQWSGASQNQPKIDSNYKNPECEVKLRKLSVLTDFNLDDRWLQMGISSSSTTALY